MERSSPGTIAVIAADQWIGRLLVDFLEMRGWGAEPVHPMRVERERERIGACAVVLCDLDLRPVHLEVVRAAGRPLVYFSSSSRLRDVAVPGDAAATFELPPDWEKLDRLLRSLI